MQRCIAFLFAMFLTSLTVASACTAAVGERVGFTIEPARDGSQLRVTFRDDDRYDDNRWSSSFAPAQLGGLDLAALRGAGSHPVGFTVSREAGRLACSGNGGSGYGHGECLFAPDASFLALLQSRGIRAPSRDEAFGLMALDVRRSLIDGIAAARYPVPTIDQLTSMTAVGVRGQYIAELARLGYRPRSIDNLVEFRALNITPDYVADFSRIGYRNIDPDSLVQFKALGITAEYVEGFERIGYRNLPADTLVQLKALDISPEFVRAAEQQPGVMPSIGQLSVLQSLPRRNGRGN
jgi:hypothetical protein